MKCYGVVLWACKGEREVFLEGEFQESFLEEVVLRLWLEV